MNINAPHKSINTHKMKTSGYTGELERERNYQNALLISLIQTNNIDKK